jgi:transposase-like protein
MTANLQNPIFHDEDLARAALEAVRWPNGPFCPHCGNSDPNRIAKIEGIKQSHRPGLRYCNECKGQFTVTVGTVFERSKIPLSKWWLAMHLMGASKKGVSAHQLWRMLGFGSYRTAWFMAHRIREAMKELNPTPIGGEGKIVDPTPPTLAARKRTNRLASVSAATLAAWASKSTTHSLSVMGVLARAPDRATASRRP